VNAIPSYATGAPIPALYTQKASITAGEDKKPIIGSPSKIVPTNWTARLVLDAALIFPAFIRNHFTPQALTASTAHFSAVAARLRFAAKSA
jgi:hypothetical protein